MCRCIFCRCRSLPFFSPFACFRIKGNVGFFIALIDFTGYMGTVALLSTKELLNIDVEWFALFNHIACVVGAVCSILFTIVGILIYKKYNRMFKQKETNYDTDYTYINAQYNTI